MRKKNYEK